MDLEQGLYNLKMDGEDMKGLKGAADQYSKLHESFFDEKKGAAGGKLLNVLASYKRGNRDFGDNEILLVLQDENVLKEYRSALDELARGTSMFSREGRKIRYMNKVLKDAYKTIRSMKDYLAKNKKAQLGRILAPYEEQESKASEAHQGVKSLVNPLLYKK